MKLSSVICLLASATSILALDQALKDGVKVAGDDTSITITVTGGGPR